MDNDEQEQLCKRRQGIGCKFLTSMKRLFHKLIIGIIPIFIVLSCFAIIMDLYFIVRLVFNFVFWNCKSYITCKLWIGSATAPTMFINNKW
jgi:hypothetical protein